MKGESAKRRLAVESGVKALGALELGVTTRADRKRIDQIRQALHALDAEQDDAKRLLMELFLCLQDNSEHTDTVIDQVGTFLCSRRARKTKRSRKAA